MTSQNRRLRGIFAMVCLALPLASAWAAPSWQTGYKGEDATGADVMAFYNFDVGDGVGDAAGRAPNIALAGKSRLEPNGKIGACLECFPSGQGLDDKAQGAVAKKNPVFDPAGPFTVEMWISLRDDAAQRKTMILLDNKYYHYPKPIGAKANSGMCLYMRRRGEKWDLVAFLGYGEDSVAFTCPSQPIPLNVWTHVAFTYDGQGKGVWYVNGEKVSEKAEEGRGAIAPAVYNLTIGERVGSTRSGFAGYIDELRISKVARTFEP